MLKTLKAKIFALISVAALVMIFLWGLNYRNYTALNKEIHYLGKDRVIVSELIQQMNVSNNAIPRYMWLAEAFDKSEEKRLATIENAFAALETLEISFSKYKSLSHPADIVGKLNEITPNIASLREVLTAAKKIMLSSDSAIKSTSKQFLLDKMPINALKITDVIAFVTQIEGKITDQAVASSLEQSQMAVRLVSIVTLITIVVFFSFGNYFGNNISSTINFLTKNLNEVSGLVGKDSESIAQHARSLAEATTEQASSLEETAAGITQLNATISRNSENASSSVKISESVNTVTENGMQSAKSMIESMSEIKESNDKIATQMNSNLEGLSELVEVIKEINQKTKVINDIVFQTKLLSFNASVEAARAGENGKGFSVVAEEIGTLASLSGNAAHDIGSLLERSLKRSNELLKTIRIEIESNIKVASASVNNGDKNAHDCNKILVEIAQKAEESKLMSSEIAGASIEQSRGVNEITTAVDQLNQVTHQNSQSANELSNTSSQLKERVLQLNQIVTGLVKIIEG